MRNMSEIILNIVTGILISLCIIVLLWGKSDLFIDSQIVPRFFALKSFLLLLIIAISVKIAFNIKIPKIHIDVIFFSIALIFISYTIIQLVDCVNSVNSINSPEIACYISIGIPFIIYFIRKDIKYLNYILYALIPVCLIPLFYIKSRTGYICGLIAILSMLRIPKRYKPYMGQTAIVAIAALLLTFSFKKDSSSGRFFIFRRSLEMVAERPLFGWGTDGFKANYMNFQADYFQSNPDSHYGLLADNITHPLNEFLLILVNHGIIGLSIVLLLLYGLLKKSFSTDDLHNKTISLSLFTLIVWSCFSYPFSFAAPIFILAINIILLNREGLMRNIQPKYMRITALCIMLGAVTYGVFVYKEITNNMQWKKAYAEFNGGEKEKALQEYEGLLPKLNTNSSFLSNYTSVLYEYEDFNKALHIAKLYQSHRANYDLQILLGNIYFNLNRMDEAIACFNEAATMCPVRFIPLFNIYKIYKITNRTEDMINIGELILNKKVKISSYLINIIKEVVEEDLQKIEAVNL